MQRTSYAKGKKIAQSGNYILLVLNPFLHILLVKRKGWVEEKL
jgi:hypothetical protein